MQRLIKVIKNQFNGFIVGLLIGSILSGTYVYAATRIKLVNGAGIEIGTASNPLYIQ